MNDVGKIYISFAIENVKFYENILISNNDAEILKRVLLGFLGATRERESPSLRERRRKTVRERE